MSESGLLYTVPMTSQEVMARWQAKTPTAPLKGVLVYLEDVREWYAFDGEAFLRLGHRSDEESKLALDKYGSFAFRI
jgi:hypothetical protein